MAAGNVLFDPSVSPGWFDYATLVLTLIGFAVSIYQVLKARSAVEAAAGALATAQKHLSQRSLMAVAPQIQLVVSDLTYALPRNDGEVAHRTLVRFALLAKEARGILQGMEGDYSDLILRLDGAADRATRVKATIVTAPDPDVISLTKTVSKDIDRISQDLAGISAGLRNTIEG